jgi:tripartite-type tricarboxylate transporter receptor subunit TctC
MSGWSSVDGRVDGSGASRRKSHGTGLSRVVLQILDLHRAGKVRILSVNSQTPIRSAPDIPTSIDAGLQGMVAQTTFGIFAPAGTSRSILDRINAVTQQAMSDQQFQAELIRTGFEPVLDVGPDKAAGVFQDELVRWTPILITLGAKPE